MNALDLPDNPIIRNKFTADPTAIVVDDKILLYTGHDEAALGQTEYVMNDWLCFSSADLMHWQEHPSPLKARDFSWSAGGAYATKMVRKGNDFYWFVAVNDKTGGTAIGVAVSHSPTLGFHDMIGAPLVTFGSIPSTNNKKANLDPSVLIDDDGTVYMFWGNSTCYFARLSPSMTAIDSDIRMINLPDFSEGAHIHKRNGWYYLSYGCGMPERVAYSMSRDIHGPWIYKGILNERVENCETNRPCVVDFRGRSYYFYHNGALPDGGSHRRSVCVDELYYRNDGSIETIRMT